MADQTNAHSSPAKQERSITDAPQAIENLYYLLNLDVREAAMAYDLGHDEILVEIWKMLLRDMFAAGASSVAVHDVVRLVYAVSRRERG